MYIDSVLIWIPLFGLVATATEAIIADMLTMNRGWGDLIERLAFGFGWFRVDIELDCSCYCMM
jgi:hypothetical protein